MTVTLQKMKSQKLKITTLHAGLVTGFWAAIAQALWVSPPSAYGICFINHPRDLLNWSMNSGFGTSLFVHGASLDIPVLTVVGVLAGSFVATARHKEFNFRRARDPVSSLIYGFLAANFGALLGYCSIRIIMVTAYGSLIALIGVIDMIFGVFAAIKFVKWRSRH
jgi:hypothetical protein